MSGFENDASELRDVLLRNGFVPCDIPACSCGSWHPRFGLYERMDEIKSDLADAGHPLTNENGNSPRHALLDLIDERDRLRAALDEAIALRVEVYRASDLEGDTDHLSDGQIARRDPYAKKWLVARGKE
ncbi:MAG: hypothetical protein J5J04_17300 [Anaerolineae bacterium]|nr:hypothetical protein [Anaerolineae bacterium]